MTPVEIMARLAATASRKGKEQILLEAFQDNSHEFFHGLRLALDPLVKFHISKVAKIVEDDGDPGDYTFADFLILTQKLRGSDLTGEAARDAIRAAATRCDAATWNQFYRRILLHDLNVGMTAKAINRVLRSIPEAQHCLIPLFECQSACDGDAAQQQKYLHGRKLMEVNFEGVRTLAILDSEGVGLYLRSGLRLNQFPEIYAALHQLFPRLPGPLVLDGTLVAPQGKHQMMTLVRQQEYDPGMAATRYALFDIFPLGDFRRGLCNKPQHERHRLLETLQECGLWNQTEGHIHVVPHVEVNLDNERTQVDEFMWQAQADGFTHVMLKDPEAPYRAQRSSAWLRCRIRNT